MPSNIAFMALLLWPIIVFILFKSMSRAEALIWSILGGYLLLPYGVGVDLPMLPALDKTLIPAISAMAMLLLLPKEQQNRRHITSRRFADSPGTPAPPASVVFSQRQNRRNRGQFLASDNNRNANKSRVILLERALLMLLFLTPFLTVIQNSEPYLVGTRWLSGLRMYDALSMILSSFVSVLPYLLARRYLGHPEQHVLLLRSLSIAGLLYSFPALFEIRMSPQLSKWIYGFLSQPFSQVIRDEGFRPVIFLQHGLWLAIFMAISLLSALALWRFERRRSLWLLIGLWLLGTLSLSHSLGGLAIAIMLMPVVLLGPVRGQMILAAGVAFVILTYPLLRGVDWIPVGRIVEAAETISPQRARSFEFRLRNEDILLAHANMKPLSGWGGWGRARVYDEQTGRDITITDGMWIIIVGESGWLGYFAKFGLLTLSIVALALNYRHAHISLATSGLCLVLIANLIDMIPNATLTPVTWLIAGAVMGNAVRARDAGESGFKISQSHLSKRSPQYLKNRNL